MKIRPPRSLFIVRGKDKHLPPLDRVNKDKEDKRPPPFAAEEAQALPVGWK